MSAWQCPACRVENDKEICKVCGTFRGMTEENLTWECTLCTYENSSNNKLCDACGNKRGDAKIVKTVPLFPSQSTLPSSSTLSHVPPTSTSLSTRISTPPISAPPSYPSGKSISSETVPRPIQTGLTNSSSEGVPRRSFGETIPPSSSTPVKKNGTKSNDERLIELLTQRENEIKELRKKLSTPLFQKSKSLHVVAPESCDFKTIVIEGNSFVGGNLEVHATLSVGSSSISTLHTHLKQFEINWFRIDKVGSHVKVGSGLKYTLMVADIGCFIAVNVKSLYSKSEAHKVTDGAVRLHPDTGAHLENLFKAGTDIHFPVINVNNPVADPKKGWSLLINKDKLKVRIGGVTRIKAKWDENIQIIEDFKVNTQFILSINGTFQELFGTLRKEERTLGVACIQLFLSAMEMKNLGTPTKWNSGFTSSMLLTLSSSIASFNRQPVIIIPPQKNLIAEEEISNKLNVEDLSNLFKYSESIAREGLLNSKDAALLASMLTVGLSGPNIGFASAALVSAVPGGSLSTTSALVTNTSNLIPKSEEIINERPMLERPPSIKLVTQPIPIPVRREQETKVILPKEETKSIIIPHPIINIPVSKSEQMVSNNTPIENKKEISEESKKVNDVKITNKDEKLIVGDSNVERKIAEAISKAKEKETASDIAPIEMLASPSSTISNTGSMKKDGIKSFEAQKLALEEEKKKKEAERLLLIEKRLQRGSSSITSPPTTPGSSSTNPTKKKVMIPL